VTVQLYELAITATAEIRDADGNLVSADPIASTIEVTEAQLRELGITPPEEA